MNRDPLHEIIVGTLSDLAKMVVGFGVFALWAIVLIGVAG